jgi:periplasmic protein CpxP/Spy
MESKGIKFWKIFAIVLIALNIVLIVFMLKGPPRGRHPGGKEDGAPGKFLVKKLKLTAKQEAEFNILREAHHDSIEVLISKEKKLKKSFVDGLISDAASGDEDSILNLIAENKKQVELLTYKHFQEVKKICTSEQKVIFNDIIGDIIEKIGSPPPPPPSGDPPGHEGRRD